MFCLALEIKDWNQVLFLYLAFFSCSIILRSITFPGCYHRGWILSVWVGYPFVIKHILILCLDSLYSGHGIKIYIVWQGMLSLSLIFIWLLLVSTLFSFLTTNLLYSSLSMCPTFSFSDVVSPDKSTQFIFFTRKLFLLA